MPPQTICRTQSTRTQKHVAAALMHSCAYNKHCGITVILKQTTKDVLAMSIAKTVVALRLAFRTRVLRKSGYFVLISGQSCFELTFYCKVVCETIAHGHVPSEETSSWCPNLFFPLANLVELFYFKILLKKNKTENRWKPLQTGYRYRLEVPIPVHGVHDQRTREPRRNSQTTYVWLCFCSWHLVREWSSKLFLKYKCVCVCVCVCVCFVNSSPVSNLSIIWWIANMDVMTVVASLLCCAVQWNSSGNNKIISFQIWTARQARWCKFCKFGWQFVLFYPF